LHLSSAAFRAVWEKNSPSQRSRRSPPTSRRALSGFARKGDYFESDEYLLSSRSAICSSSRFRTSTSEEGKWSFKHLPVIPPHFELAPLEKSEQRLNLLLRLMKRKDVSGLINACDAGREGELISATSSSTRASKSRSSACGCNR